MPSPVQCISLTCLIIVSLAAGLQALEATSMDILEGDWYTFRCDYNEDIDANKYHELGVDVLQCTDPVQAVLNPKDVTLVAAVLGRMTARLSPDMKSTFMNDEETPIYYANPNNKYVKEGLVEVLGGDLSSISIRIKATPKTSRICIVCAQTMASIGLIDTQRISLKLRAPPAASLTLDGAPVAHDERKPMAQGQVAIIGCTATGPETLSVKLMRNTVMVARADSDSLTHKIANTSRDSAGIYRCEAATNLPFLVQRNSHNGSAEFVLAVKFAPQIELSEIVRYTALGKQEDIQIRAVATSPHSNLLTTHRHA